MDDSTKQFYCQEDIASQLYAVQAALYIITITNNNDPHQAAYLEGFEAALHCVAKGFNLYLSLSPEGGCFN